MVAPLRMQTTMTAPTPTRHRNPMQTPPQPFNPTIPDSMRDQASQVQDRWNQVRTQNDMMNRAGTFRPGSPPTPYGMQTGWSQRNGQNRWAEGYGPRTNASVAGVDPHSGAGLPAIVTRDWARQQAQGRQVGAGGQYIGPARDGVNMRFRMPGGGIGTTMMSPPHPDAPVRPPPAGANMTGWYPGAIDPQRMAEIQAQIQQGLGQYRNAGTFHRSPGTPFLERIVRG
jgi:hypothetical protein